MGVEVRKEIRRNAYIATLRKARRSYKCAECGWPIWTNDYYYQVVAGGGGLGWLKYPERVHWMCINPYLGGE